MSEIVRKPRAQAYPAVSHDRPNMKRFGIALAHSLLGYVAMALLGYVAIGQFSTNVHDRQLEAAMTAAFVTGPLGAVIDFIVGFMRGGRW